VFPELFRFTLFGHVIPLRTFGLFVAAGFLVAVWKATRLSFKYGNPKDHESAGDIAWWVLIGVIGGGRLAYVLVHLDYFLGNPLRIFAIWEGGLVMYGGLILASVLGLWKMHKNGLDLWRTGDFALTAAFLGQAIGRLGCFSVGDDYGRVTDVPWALHLPDPLPQGSLFPPELAGKFVHPTQLYMALSALSLFLFGLWLLRRRRFKGQVFCILLAGYAVLRFMNELFRADFKARGGIWSLSPEEAARQGAEPVLFLSTSQLVGLTVIPLALGLYLWLRRRPGGAIEPGTYGRRPVRTD